MSDTVEPVVIISDVHLSAASDWRAQLRAMAGLWQDARTIVFNGDTLNHSLAANDIERGAVLEMIADLCRRDDVRPVILSGNSDHLLEGPRHAYLSAGRVLALHGEVIFPGLSPWRDDAKQIAAAFEEAIAQMDTSRVHTLEGVLTAARQSLLRCYHGSIPRLTCPNVNVRRQLLWQTRWLRRPLRAIAVLNAWRRMPRLADAFCRTYAPETQVIVFGHAHRRGLWQVGGRTIINTGSFDGLGGPSMVTVHDGTVTVRKVKSRGGMRQPGSVITEIALPHPAARDD